MTDKRATPNEDGPLSKRRALALCSEIEQIKGRVTPKTLLERARPNTSPIHELFEWDDSVAAEKHRVEQARRLIASVTITIVNVKHPVRQYHSVPVRIVTGPSRREFVTRAVAVANTEHMLNISADRYAMLVSIAKYVDDIGLSKSDAAWGNLCRAIAQNVPVAVRKRREKED
jgi:hypothetical protein